MTKSILLGRAWYAKRSKAIRENWTWYWASAARSVKRRRTVLRNLRAY